MRRQTPLISISLILLLTAPAIALNTAAPMATEAPWTAWVTTQIESGEPGAIFGPTPQNGFDLDQYNRPHFATSYNIEFPGYNHVTYLWFDGETWHKTRYHNTSLSPSLELDSTGRPHFSFFEIAENAWHMLYATWDEQDGWQTTRLGYGDQSRVVVDRWDQPHVVYSSWLDGAYYAHRESNGIWTVERIATGTEVYGRGPDVAIDADGRAHVVYSLTNDNTMYAVREPNGSWTQSLAFPHCYEPNIELDSQERPHIVCNDRQSTGLIYAVLTNGTWQAERLFEGDRDMGDQPSLALDSQDRPHISHQPAWGPTTWFSPQTQLRYSTKTDAGWVHEIADRDGNLNSYFSTLRLDTQDRPWIAHYNWWRFDRPPAFSNDYLVDPGQELLITRPLAAWLATATREPTSIVPPQLPGRNEPPTY